VVLPKHVENRGALVIGMAELPSARVLGAPRLEKKPAATTWTPSHSNKGEMGEPDNDDNGELGKIPGRPYRLADERQHRAQDRDDEQNAQEDGEPAREANQFRADIRRRGLSLDVR
jgi:hypothetical protein